MPKSRSRLRLMLIAGAAFVLLAGAAAALYVSFFRGPAFFRRDVVINLLLPLGVRGGEEIELKITVENKTPFPLTGAELALDFPEGTIVAGEQRLREARPVGTIAAQGLWETIVPLRLIGPKDAKRTFTARLTYRPGDISSRFENTAEAATVILSTPFLFSLDLPKEAFPASEAEYVLTYENTAGAPLADVVLAVEYPDAFVFREASPAPTEDTTRWHLGELAGGRRGTVTLQGAFKADARLNQELRASLGIMVQDQFIPYAEIAGITQIVKPFLELQTGVQGRPEYTASPGERLSYHATWRNVGPVALENVLVRARLVSPLLDIGSLTPHQGVFDSRENEIVWTSREVPELAVVTPNETGAVFFEINVKPPPAIISAQDREFNVETFWVIETATVPKELHLTRIISEAKVVTPLASTAELAALGFSKEPSAALTNSGPTPPTVNETTTYTIHWAIKSFANPIEGVLVRAALASGVQFLHKSASISGGAPLPEFDERTGEITWRVPRVEPASGILQPPVEVVFQVAITPSTLQRNTAPVLLSESSLTAVDAFTRTRLTATVPLITTATVQGGGLVQ